MFESNLSKQKRKIIGWNKSLFRALKDVDGYDENHFGRQ